jgi:hypothetical protein
MSVKSWHTTPISWCGLERGADVISADGNRIGQVQHVLADGSTDAFEGVLIDIRIGVGGLRFLVASEIALIFEDRIVLTLSGQQVHASPSCASIPRPDRASRGRSRCARRVASPGSSCPPPSEAHPNG